MKDLRRFVREISGLQLDLIQVDTMKKELANIVKNPKPMDPENTSDERDIRYDACLQIQKELTLMQGGEDTESISNLIDLAFELTDLIYPLILLHKAQPDCNLRKWTSIVKDLYEGPVINVDPDFYKLTDKILGNKS